MSQSLDESMIFYPSDSSSSILAFSDRFRVIDTHETQIEGGYGFSEEFRYIGKYSTVLQMFLNINPYRVLNSLDNRILQFDFRISENASFYEKFNFMNAVLAKLKMKLRKIEKEVDYKYLVPLGNKNLNLNKVDTSGINFRRYNDSQFKLNGVLYCKGNYYQWPIEKFFDLYLEVSPLIQDEYFEQLNSKELEGKSVDELRIALNKVGLNLERKRGILEFYELVKL